MGLNAVLGGASLLQGKGAQKKAQSQADKAFQQQQQLLGLQVGNYKENKKLYDMYDPAKQTELALQAYDSAAAESLNRDIGNSTVVQGELGFGQGQSSDRVGAAKDIIGNRAFQRGQYLSGLKLAEPFKKKEMLSGANQAAGMLGGAASQYGQLGAGFMNQASSYDPSGAIQQVGGAFKGIKFPWEKKKPINYQSSPNYGQA